MISKVKLGLASTLLALMSATSVQAQNLRLVEREFVGSSPIMLQSPLSAVPAPEVMHDHAWYEAQTYTWTDANGITHTAALTDEVTDPYQMYDMLRWVYCNPEIPGMIYTNNTTNKGTVYYGKQTYATYDKSALQWNRFVHDFCADDATKGFKIGLKAAAGLWKIVRDSDREKKDSRALLEEFRKEL